MLTASLIFAATYLVLAIGRLPGFRAGIPLTILTMAAGIWLLR
jgi:hypothetical protein